MRLAGGLFKLKPQEVQVSLSGVIASGEPWDERTTQLVRELDDIGVSLEGTRPSRGSFLREPACRERHLSSSLTRADARSFSH